MITGPSSGIGRAFAEQLAAKGMNLVLVSRDAARLEVIANELAERYGVGAAVLAADLSTVAGIEAVEARLRDEARPIHTLVNNAGYGAGTAFDGMSSAEVDAMIALHVAAVTRLSHAALPGMRARDAGVIINVASVAGVLPAASTPLYGATKAYEIALTEGLAAALAASPVRVLAVCPGLTRTQFHARAQMDLSRLPAWVWLRPERVVAEALAAVERDAVVVVPSRRYRVLLGAARLVPRRVTHAVVRRADPRRRFER